MCMLGNIAVMEHDKTPSLRPGPPIARKLLGCVLTSQKEVRGDLVLFTEQLPQPVSRNPRQLVELSCAE